MLVNTFPWYHNPFLETFSDSAHFFVMRTLYTNFEKIGIALGFVAEAEKNKLHSEQNDFIMFFCKMRNACDCGIISQL